MSNVHNWNTRDDSHPPPRDIDYDIHILAYLIRAFRLGTQDYTPSPRLTISISITTSISHLYMDIIGTGVPLPIVSHTFNDINSNISLSLVHGHLWRNTYPPPCPDTFI